MMNTDHHELEEYVMFSRIKYLLATRHLSIFDGIILSAAIIGTVIVVVGIK